VRHRASEHEDDSQHRDGVMGRWWQQPPKGEARARAGL
jgi:hypothetical protein